VTPGARVAAAIEILDDILAGTPAEKVLTSWARSHRFAGSKDRAAIRDHTFDALRRLHSSQALGGGEDGRAVMIGVLRGQNIDPDTLFHGEGHAPAPLSEAERAVDATSLSHAQSLDCPEWLLPKFEASLGADCDAVLGRLQDRAPVFLRVNLGQTTRQDAIALLAQAGIVAVPHDLSPSALEVLENPRKISMSEAYQSGMVELQDVASQALVDQLNIQPGMRVLDFCAGGGGKALAMAALGAKVVAHDVAPQRMNDLPDRAERAGVFIKTASTRELPALGPFDLVLADAPCSGSGAWRRSPYGKWALTQNGLDEVIIVQSSILNEISKFAGDEGRLAYATCSLFQDENQTQIAGFLQGAPAWEVASERQFTPLDGGDGFYVALLTRETSRD